MKRRGEQDLDEPVPGQLAIDEDEVEQYWARQWSLAREEKRA